MTDKHKLWCPHADYNINVSTNGVISTCCWSQPVIDSATGHPYNIQTHTVSEAYNSPEFQKIRNNLRSNIPDSNCNKCWEVENLGGKSVRTEEKDSYIDDNVLHISEPTLQTLTLDLSNQCNLKCRTCSPDDSSLWIKEHYDIYGSKTIKIQDYHRSYNNNLQHEKKFYDDLKNNVLPGVREIHFKGGEPMLLKQQWELVDHMIDSGISSTKTIAYHTNATIWNKDIEEKLSNFNVVGIGCSIDDILHRYEYLRHPGKWDVIQENIDKIQRWCQQSTNRILVINVVVSIYNVLTIAELVDYFHRQNIPIFLHPTVSPPYFSITNLPNNIKRTVKKELSKNSWPTEYSREVDNVMTMMFGKPQDPGLWREFLDRTRKHDEYRKEDFKKTFPELWTNIKS
jgi:molybdenum cofactor biosynthesis enzyme MoaA